jgi:hypothetical protein
MRPHPSGAVMQTFMWKIASYFKAVYLTGLAWDRRSASALFLLVTGQTMLSSTLNRLLPVESRQMTSRASLSDNLAPPCTSEWHARQSVIRFCPESSPPRLAKIFVVYLQAGPAATTLAPPTVTSQHLLPKSIVQLRIQPQPGALGRSLLGHFVQKSLPLVARKKLEEP